MKKEKVFLRRKCVTGNVSIGNIIPGKYTGNKGNIIMIFGWCQEKMKKVTGEHASLAGKSKYMVFRTLTCYTQ